MTAFVDGIVDFTTVLRERHGFGVGPATTRDALRAAAHAGVDDGARLRRALRAVYCANRAEAERFDAAFDDFFFGAHGIAQPNLRARKTRPGTPRERAPDEPAQPRPSARPDATAGEASGARASAVRRVPTAPGESLAETWRAMRARYSAAAARTAPPVVPVAGLDAMLETVDRLLARARVAPSRRRTPQRRGDRVDVRRTLRGSVATAGEPIALQRTARTPRAARFVVLIDGSRSVAEHAGPMLQFAYALVQRAPKTNAFAFSTGLRDVTAMLRDPRRAGRALDELGDAWGGGTRIGASLRTFVREHGARTLSASTIVLLFSDGLDVGDLDVLARALRELRSRTAGIVWLHPHAASPSFAPSAGGLRTARPYVRALYAAGTPSDFERLAAQADRLGRHAPAAT
jgi:hypothetical protein